LIQSSGISRLRQNGVYLITGGLGGIGLEMAEHLAKTLRPKLILIGRSAVPAREEWDTLLRCGDEKISPKIGKLQSLEALGAELLIMSADVGSPGDMERVVASARARFGSLNGVIHCAGVADYGGIIQRRTRQSIEEILSPKLDGTLIIDALLKNEKLDFFVLFSSLSSILYQAKFGQVGYAAGNEFLDAFAQQSSLKERFVVAVNWCDWREVGMSVEAVKRWAKSQGTVYDPTLHSDSLSLSEAMDVFDRIVACPFSRVAVSPRDLLSALKNDQPAFGPALRASLYRPKHARPDLATGYQAPTNQVEKMLIDIWQELLGLDKVGIHDDFFDLGGHSLLGTQVLSRVRERSQVSLPLRSLFEARTVSHMAAAIVEKQRNELAPGQLEGLLDELELLSAEEAQVLLTKHAK